MLVERTDLTIEEMRASDFEAAMADRGVSLLRAVPGGAGRRVWTRS